MQSIGFSDRAIGLIIILWFIWYCQLLTPRTIKSYVPVFIVTHTGRCRLLQVRFENMA